MIKLFKMTMMKNKKLKRRRDTMRKVFLFILFSCFATNVSPTNNYLHYFNSLKAAKKVFDASVPVSGLLCLGNAGWLAKRVYSDKEKNEMVKELWSLTKTLEFRKAFKRFYSEVKKDKWFGVHLASNVCTTALFLSLFFVYLKREKILSQGINWAGERFFGDLWNGMLLV